MGKTIKKEGGVPLPHENEKRQKPNVHDISHTPGTEYEKNSSKGNDIQKQKSKATIHT